MCGGSTFLARRRGEILFQRGEIWTSWSIRFRRARALSLESYFGLKESLEALFGRGVDLVEPGAMRTPYLKASVGVSRDRF